MIYRTICTQLWTDKKIQRLTVQGKLLFVYLITNPHTHLSGIYYLPKELILKETGLTNTLCDTLFHTISSEAWNLAHYDRESSTVFVVNMFRYQGTGEKNERSAANQLKGLHDTYLIPLFLRTYPKVMEFCPDTLLDTVSDTVSDPSKRFPSVPDPVLLISSPDLKSNGHTKPPKRVLRSISEDDKPSEKHFRFGKLIGVDVGPEWGKFKNYCLAHDKRYANFDAAFRNWLANANSMKGARA